MLKKYSETIIDIACEIAGSFLIASGIFCFIEKVNVAPGGVSGVAIMIKYLTGLPVGLLSFVLNIPLLILAYKFISRNFAVRSIRTVIMNTLILDTVVTPFFPQYTGDRMIASIFGGVLMGLGLGIIFLRGSSTAGTDIISWILGKRFPQLPIGKTLLFTDLIILSASIFVFRNIESALFGIIALFCQTVIIDKIVYSTEKGRSILVISGKTEEISKRILFEKSRGATFLNAEGAYSKRPTKVLLCAVRVWEFHDIKKIVYEEDPKAFVIACEAENVMGEGFSKNE